MTSLLDLPMIDRNPVLRKGAAQVLRLARMAVQQQQGLPPILINSVPKSGTHLALQLARALPKAQYFGQFHASQPSLTLRPRRAITSARWVRCLRPAEVAGAHLHSSDAVRTAIARRGILHLFVIRDPRDVIWSEMHYLTHMAPWHAMHRPFRRAGSVAVRLELSLAGASDRFPDARTRLMAYAGWLDSAHVLRFEDLRADPHAALAPVIGGGWRLPAAKQLARAVRPERSHTFHKGTSGGWRDLPPDLQDRMTEALHPVLERFGYEV